MYDITIVGCGVIGAAIAYELAKYDLHVLVLERENDISMGTTRANSAIVHAGYDPEHGTLMAKLNVRGSGVMADICRRLSVPYRQTGSLVLAFSEADEAALQHMLENGRRNGVSGLKLLSAQEAKALEPNISDAVTGALHAPSAAIIDPWGLCIALAETAVRNGVTVRCRSAVQKIAEDADGCYRITTANGTYHSRYLINAAGAWAEEIDRMTGGHTFETHPSRGEYYLLDKSSGSLVDRVIFQCPTAAGKGVLLAPTVHGNLIVGPNAQDVASPSDVANTAAGLREVASSAARSVPGVDLRQSIRNFAGVRANTSLPDFLIAPSESSPHLLHVAGIKSPGLSAAPAIAEYAVRQLKEMGIALNPKDNFIDTRSQIRFHDLSPQEKAAQIAKNPLYGRVICRCETVTEGEIVDAIHSPIPPCSIDGIKRRTGAGMGRCQSGFCGPRVLEILSRELGLPPTAILQDKDGTFLITGYTKTGGSCI